MTLEERVTELIARDQNAKAIMEACNPTINLELNSADFCWVQFERALPKDTGKVGLLHLIRNSRSIALADQQTLIDGIRWSHPPCAQGEACNHEWWYTTGPLKPGYVLMTNCDYQAAAKNPAYDWSGIKGVTMKRERSTEWFGLLDGLRYEAARLRALEEGTTAPEQPKGIDVVNVPNDAAEPLYVVRSFADAHRYYIDLKFKKRLADNEITRGYARNAFYVCDDDAREAVLLLSKPEEMTGPLSWKPVVLTFADSELESSLQDFCSQVVTVLPHKTGVMSLAAVKAAVKVLAEMKVRGIPDMPEEVLDGWLGRVYKERMSGFPIAFGWPALLTAASVLVPHSPNPRNRTNLFTVIVSPKGAGKSTAFDYAFRLLDIKSPPLLKLKAGSAEQLAKRIGDVGGASRLYYTDELEHLLLKAAIQGASFATVLNTAFNEDEQDIIIARGKDASMKCRLSVAGGVVDDRFNDLFGAATTGGFYDRFIFGVAPTDYVFKYRDFTGSPALHAPSDIDDGMNFAERPVPVEIDSDVWDERDRIAEDLKIPPADRRILELGIRCAVIAASLDGRRTLRAADLGPMRAFVEYQRRVRKMLKPNPGKNSHAIVGCKFRDYLDEYSPNGEWVGRRDMVHRTRAADDWGAVTVNSVLQALAMAGDIELGLLGKKKVLKALR